MIYLSGILAIVFLFIEYFWLSNGSGDMSKGNYRSL